MGARAIWGAVAALALLTAPAFAQEDCAASKTRVSAAVKSGDVATIEAAVKAARADAACSGAAQLSLARLGSLALAGRAEGLPPAERLQALEQAASLSPSAPPWQVLATLGRIHYDARNYGLAQILFERALNDIEDVATTPAPPPAEAITKIHALAGQARMLAPRPAAPPPGRSGGGGGLALDRVRGMEVERAPLPVRFVYDQATFTPEGLEDAAFMRGYLREQGDPSILLTGHTDPKGDDAYNCRLSWRRVAALEKYLKDQGYAGRIAVVGMGERQPRKVFEAEKLTEAENHQLQRRVEYFKENETPEIANACPRS